MTVLGIDPGINGAVAVLTDDGNMLGIHDLPTNAVKIGGTNRKVIDATALIACWRQLATPKSLWNVLARVQQTGQRLLILSDTPPRRFTRA